MASQSNTTQFINDKVLNLTVNEKDTLQLPHTKEDGSVKRSRSLHSLDNLESDLSKNKYCTDADVLKAVCVFSESPVSDSDDTFERKSTSPQGGFLEVNNVIQSEMFSDNNSVNSLDYWSDEEGCYPPQMSLSPPPGEPSFRRTTLTAVNEIKEYKENEHAKNVAANDDVKDVIRRSSSDLPRTYLKRSLVRTLSPITSKHPLYNSHPHKYQTIPNVRETSSQCITPSFLINSNECLTRSMASSQLYNWEPRPPNDLTISSPSLIRPTISTPPRTRKHKQSSTATEIIALSYSNRMKEDNLFDRQRSLMPKAKRKVSRSQSSYTTTPTKLFPEISGIAKTQAASKSISDFRQSSSIFGKLVKKNNIKETANVGKNDTNSNKPSKITDSTSTSSSRSKSGEKTRGKLRRILSLH